MQQRRLQSIDRQPPSTTLSISLLTHIVYLMALPLQGRYAIDKLAARTLCGGGWCVTLKSLMVFHRLASEANHSSGHTELFQVRRFERGFGVGPYTQEMPPPPPIPHPAPLYPYHFFFKQQNATRYHLRRLEDYSDHSSPESKDFSAFVRAYAACLGEGLKPHKVLRLHEGSGIEPGSLAAMTDTSKLMEVMEVLHNMVFCSMLLPEGAAAVHPVPCTVRRDA